MNHHVSIICGITLTAAWLAGSTYGEEKAGQPTDKIRNLPNVLILGDSISQGYTPSVRRLLKGKVNIHRPNGNHMHSAHGAKMIKKWLGDKKWDVVYFNFGIWDIHPLLDGKTIVWPKDRAKYPQGKISIRHTPNQYIENLSKIITVLKTSKAKLIWASTTPVSIWKDSPESIARNNKAAGDLMIRHGVTVNDLHRYASVNIEKWQRDDKCHFNKLGNDALGKRVAQSISSALGHRADVGE